MRKERYKKLLIISFIVFFSFVSIMAVVIGENVLHNEKCQITDCPLCILITVSSNFMKNMNLITISIFILIVIVPLMQLINKNTGEKEKLTLVELKVIQIR